jgi:myo-inositol-1(or 4)-monophosphatase
VKELLVELALGLREHVYPLLGSHAGREHTQAGAGGDMTFAIDEQAEGWVEQFLAARAPSLAFYSEDRGLVLPNRNTTADSQASRPLSDGTSLPGTVLVIDPIDGTRPAMAGLECCCVSVAAAPLGDGQPTMGEVSAACVAEIKSGTLFVAERGNGLEIRPADGELRTANLSPTADISRMFWTLGFRGRPAQPLVAVLEELIDASSVGGAVFDLGSATFDMTRIVTGQLDAYVDVGTRMIEEVPALRERFERVGGGAVLNNSPYDLAAAVLCLEEAGAIVTDAYGGPLSGRPVLGSGHEYQMSCVAAANARLHGRMLEVLERGFARLRAPSGVDLDDGGST